MPEKRKAYAPFSLITESGVANAPVEGYIEVDQLVRPTVSTGTVNEDGTWVGVKSSDKNFFAFTKHLVIPNGEVVLAPANANTDHLNMTGYSHLQIAIKPSNGGNFAIEAVMGPDTNSYANLAPVDAAATLQGAYVYPGAANDFEILFSDSAQSLTVDVWNIFMIKGILFDQKLLQFKITNNTGGDSDIEVAFMRLV